MFSNGVPGIQPACDLGNEETVGAGEVFLTPSRELPSVSDAQ
jgi:hypothetical protein